jgi:hypothetical protein
MTMPSPCLQLLTAEYLGGLSSSERGAVRFAKPSPHALERLEGA